MARNTTWYGEKITRGAFALATFPREDLAETFPANYFNLGHYQVVGSVLV